MSSPSSCDDCSVLSKDEPYGSSFALQLKSPAKINLFFRVLSKRPDGYHNIASVYQAVSLYDEITFTASSSENLTCSDPSLPTDNTNLCRRAMILFKEALSLSSLPVAIDLKKNIPMQAGLGGGSGNAATVLYGLNVLHGTPLSAQQLWSLSSQLGSDVPFFFSTGTAFCTSRGEVICPISSRCNLAEITIVKPPYGLSTPKVYQACDLSQLPLRDPLEALHAFHQGSLCLYNDLEIPSFALQPSLQELKSILLSSGFSDVIMCGSGTAFFCLGNGVVPEELCPFVYKVKSICRTESGWYE